uniref:Uncharacterized protein n=1 Tax=Trichogramma kaykai TaxID=54128 RepID=A0ABD2X0T4_9HYME
MSRCSFEVMFKVKSEVTIGFPVKKYVGYRVIDFFSPLILAAFQSFPYFWDTLYNEVIFVSRPQIFCH